MPDFDSELDCMAEDVVGQLSGDVTIELFDRTEAHADFDPDDGTSMGSVAPEDEAPAVRSSIRQIEIGGGTRSKRIRVIEYLVDDDDIDFDPSLKDKLLDPTYGTLEISDVEIQADGHLWKIRAQQAV